MKYTSPKFTHFLLGGEGVGMRVILTFTNPTDDERETVAKALRATHGRDVTVWQSNDDALTVLERLKKRGKRDDLEPLKKTGWAT